MNSNYDREQTLIGGDGEQYTLDTTRAQPFMTISDTPPTSRLTYSICHSI